MNPPSECFKLLRYLAVRWQMGYNQYRPLQRRGFYGPAVFAAKCLEDSA